MDWSLESTTWPMPHANVTELFYVTTLLEVGDRRHTISCLTPITESSKSLERFKGDNSTPSVDWGRHGGRLTTEADQMVGRQVTNKVSIAFGMILIPLVSLFGSLGNLLSLRVLVHHRMRNATNMLLAALAFSDLLVLLHALYFSFLRVYTLNDPAAGKRLRILSFPVLGPYTSVVTARITTGLTTMLSLERLVAVYYPMKAKEMCGRFMTGTCIGVIFLVTATAFIPTAMKYHAVHVPMGNHTRLTMALTSLGQNKYFFHVYGNVLNVLFRLLPITLLILVNIFIALAIRKTWSFRQTMSSGVVASYEQNRITLMLLMVSLVFLLCILPGAIHSIMTQLYPQYSRLGMQSNIHTIFSNVTYFLETLNSSVNFVIYMAYSSKFNRTYRDIFSCKPRQQSTFGMPQGSARSITRFPLRPFKGSHSSMTSYRELHILNQLRKYQDTKAEAGMHDGSLPQNGEHASGIETVQEQANGHMLRKLHCKYSIRSNESNSNHSGSHSHSGQNSRSENSQGSSCGQLADRHSEQGNQININVEQLPEEIYS